MRPPNAKVRSRAAGTAGLLGLILGLVIVAWIGIDPAIAALEWLETRIEDYFWIALLAYTVLFSLLVLTTLPVGTLFCLAGGYLFGTALGATGALLAATTGATLTLLLVREVGGRRLRGIISRGRLERWLRLLERDATWYLILLRVIPVMPFFPINAAAGATRIGVRHFMVATAIGLTPTTIIYASIGNGLNSVVEARETAGPELLLEPQVATPLALLAVLTMIGWFVHRRIHDPSP